MSNSRRLIVLLLALAAASVDAVLVQAAAGRQFPHIAALALLAAALAQIGLLAGWLAVGPGAVVGRLGACLVAVTGFSWLLSSRTRPEFHQWLGFLELYLFAVAVPVFLSRVGRAGTGTAAAVRQIESRRGATPRQWTLAGIMSLTTVVAVALSFARTAGFPRQPVELAVVSCCGFSLTTLLALSIVWRRKRAAWQFPAAVLAALVVGAAVGIMHGPAVYVRAMATVSLIQSLMIVLAAAALHEDNAAGWITRPGHNPQAQGPRSVARSTF